MQTKLKLSLAAIAIACSPLAMWSQASYSGFFSENYNYRFQMNPSAGNEMGFVSFPGMGNNHLSLHGNLKPGAFFYTNGDEVLPFTSPLVSAADVLGKIKDKNKLGVNSKIDVLTVGFNAFGGYNAIGFSVVARSEFSVPGSFFRFAKEGEDSDVREIRDMNGNISAYGQIALNHSHWINSVPGLRVGASLKFLLGIGNIDFRFRDVSLKMNNGMWDARANADIYSSVSNFSFRHDTDDLTGLRYISGADVDKFGLNGFGLGLDLGAQYIFNDFRFSAAVIDLGFIKWGKTHVASTDGTKSFRTDAFLPDSNNQNPYYGENSEWDDLGMNIGKLYNLEESETLSSRTRSLGATLNIGAQYELPAYRKLHLGILNTTRLLGDYSWTQFRFSADVNPVKWFSFSANMSAGTYGMGFGWLLSFNTKGFNLFAGMDHTSFDFSEAGVPEHPNMAVNFGINFPFGK